MNFRRLRRRLTGNHRFRNRTGSHEFSLNIPPSRKETAMRRRRWLIRTTQWTLLLGLGFQGLVQAGNLWDQAFHHRRTFAVGQFELNTNGVITAPEVSAATGLRPDQNIMDLDLARVRDALLILPQVRRVEIERRYPRDLAIHLEERRPVAWLVCLQQKLRPFDSRGMLLDAEGIAFPAGVMLNEYTSLPVIRCTDLAAVTPGRPVDSPLVQKALRLSELLGSMEWPQPMVLEQLHLKNRFTLVAQMDNDALFTFHPEQLEKQIARLRAILDHIGPGGPRVASANLQLEWNVPVTFFNAPSGPAPRAAGKAKPVGPASRRTSASPRPGL